MLPLCDLPNQDGFSFIGIARDHSEKECRVGVWPTRDGHGVIHFITGAAWSDLIGWKRKITK